MKILHSQYQVLRLTIIKIGLNLRALNGCRPEKKWEKVNILELEADQLSEYCREFGLYYERSDKGMPKFDYESYLWDGNIPDKNVWYQEKSLPDSTGNKD